MQADNVKHNQQGRVDEHGAFRHRLPEICPVGALAMLFFAYFHILDNPPPDFSPNFNDASSGEYGYRTWYGHHVFWAKSVQEEMSYDSEYCTYGLSLYAYLFICSLIQTIENES